MFVKSVLNIVKSDGTKIPYESGKGWKLVAGTYYVDVSLPDPVGLTVQMTWDQSLAATINYQGSNMPAYASLSAPETDSSAPVDVSLFDGTAGNWITEDSSAVYIPVVPGLTVANMTLTVAGNATGGTRYDLNNSYRRGRIRAIVSTGGYFRCHPHGKGA